jgi:hypothetical protein
MQFLGHTKNLFFSRKLKEFAFLFIEQEDKRGYNLHGRDTHACTHTTVVTKRLKLNEEVPPTSQHNDTRQHLASKHVVPYVGN